MKNFSEFKGLIGVVGSGSGELDEKIYKTAEKLGRLIAKENFALVCGGRFGIMEAVCKGVKSEQGFTIGFLPWFTWRCQVPQFSFEQLDIFIFVTCFRIDIYPRLTGRFVFFN